MADDAWQLPWLRLHLTTRALLTVRVTPQVKAALARCAELRRAMIDAGVVQLTTAAIVVA